MCDKPFALSVEDARRVAARATEVDRLVVPFQNRRWDSDRATLRAVLEQGLLGRSPGSSPGSSVSPPLMACLAAGGGILYDFGSHLVDQALFLFGPVDLPLRRDRSDRVPTSAVSSASSPRCSTRAAWSPTWSGTGCRERPGAVPGDRAGGAFVVGPGMDGQEDALIAGRPPAADGDVGRGGAESAWGWIQRGEERTPVPSERGRWDLLYDEFARSVRGAGPSAGPVSDAIASLTVLDACAASARTGARWPSDRLTVTRTPHRGPRHPPSGHCTQQI